MPPVSQRGACFYKYYAKELNLALTITGYCLILVRLLKAGFPPDSANREERMTITIHDVEKVTQLAKLSFVEKEKSKLCATR
jgi:hypothetical protein